MSKVIEDAAQDFAAINDDKAANSAHSYSKYDIADAYQQGADFGYSLAENRIKKEYEEKLRWIPTIEQTPTATEIGDWDGKRSDFVLAKTKNGSHYILRVYEGFSNGEKWVDWADKNDMIHTGIVEWRSFL